MTRLILSLLLLTLATAAYARSHYDDMHTAIEKNDAAKVRSLLEKMANVELRKDTRASPTFLTQAARLGRDEIVSLLLASGADVDGKDGDAMTPLMHASWRGHLKVVELLLKAGADLNAQAKWGDTALSFAKEKKYAEIATLLTKAGAKD